MFAMRGVTNVTDCYRFVRVRQVTRITGLFGVLLPCYLSFFNKKERDIEVNKYYCILLNCRRS